jgi:hypothetical protein
MKNIAILLTGCLLLSACKCFAIQEDFDKIKKISDEAVKDCKTDEEKVLALSHYVYLKLKPDETKGVSPQAQMSTCDRLGSGVGWCNHQVAVFMRLAESQKIKTRMLYLLNKEGTESPHTIGEAYIENRWVIVDPQNDFNALFSRNDVLRNPNLIKNQPIVKERFKDAKQETIDDFVELYINPSIFVYGLE